MPCDDRGTSVRVMATTPTKGTASVNRSRAGLDANGTVIAYENISKAFSRLDTATNEGRAAHTLAGHLLGELASSSVVNLLSLPRYGHYQHAYEEMLARHDELIPALSDRITVLHRGESVTEEASALYRELAGSAVPLRTPGTSRKRQKARPNSSTPTSTR